jgi:hypothetical protein
MSTMDVTLASLDAARIDASRWRRTDADRALTGLAPPSAMAIKATFEGIIVFVMVMRDLL